MRLGKRISEFLSNLLVLYAFGFFILISPISELSPLIIELVFLLHVFAFFGPTWIRRLPGQSKLAKFLKRRASDVSAVLLLYLVFIVGWFTTPEPVYTFYTLIFFPISGAIILYLWAKSAEAEEEKKNSKN